MPLTYKLVVARLGTAFMKDPAVALRGGIKDNYTILDPAKASVRFDTKFDNLGPIYQIIVKPLRISLTKEEVGAGRYRYVDRRKVHIYALGHSSIDKAYKIKEHVEDIINANQDLLQVDGIDFVEIEEFLPITVYNDAEVSKGIAESSLVTRLAATATMYYDKVKVAA